MSNVHLPSPRVPPGTAPLRVLIADDNPDLRRLLRMTLAFDDGLEVCGEATDGRQAVDSWLINRPDVVVMDLNMPVMSGLAAAELILAQAPDQPILLFSAAFSAAAHAKADALGVAMCCDKRDMGNLPALVRRLGSARRTNRQPEASQPT